MNSTEELIQIIEDLLKTKREDDWWDFKQCHHQNKADLLHDIICLANNRANRDAYIIFGVEDKTYNIHGVENDPNRRNQQVIVDFLRSKGFAGQVRPRVEVRTIRINDHELDVFIVKNSTDVPYYLTKDYNDGQKKIRANYIYTRVQDNNTPVDTSADINHVEYLWKKRFGLITTPLEQLKVLLKNPDDWVEEESRYYHKLFPQFTIVIEEEDNDRGYCRMFYHHVQTNNSFSYGMIRLFYYTTQLFSCQCTGLDGGRMTAPCPDRLFISDFEHRRKTIWIYYYSIDSIKFHLLRFLMKKIGSENGKEADNATGRSLNVVLLFEDAADAEKFKDYVSENQSLFDQLTGKQLMPYIENEPEQNIPILAQEIRECKALIEMRNNMGNKQTKLLIQHLY